MADTPDDKAAWNSLAKEVHALDAPKPKPKKRPAPSSAPPVTSASTPLAMDELIAESAQNNDENFAELFEFPPKKPTNKKVAQKAEPATPSEPKLPTRPASLAPLRIGDLTQLDKQTADRLKRGKLPVDVTLDLHGLNKNAAHDQFTGTIEHAAHSGARVILVITGKGQRSQGGRAILRVALKEWLNMPDLRPLLLACCPAQIRDGGDGAFYCLLKRKRNR